MGLLMRILTVSFDIGDCAAEADVMYRYWPEGSTRDFGCNDNREGKPESRHGDHATKNTDQERAQLEVGSHTNLI